MLFLFISTKLLYVYNFRYDKLYRDKGSTHLIKKLKLNTRFFLYFYQLVNIDGKNLMHTQ